MTHLARLITSTKTQVIFISETRNSRMTKTAIISHFNTDDAYVIPAQGLSGGLWQFGCFGTKKLNCIEDGRNNLKITNRSMLDCKFDDRLS